MNKIFNISIKAIFLVTVLISDKDAASNLEVASFCMGNYSNPYACHVESILKQDNYYKANAYNQQVAYDVLYRFADWLGRKYVSLSGRVVDCLPRYPGLFEDYEPLRGKWLDFFEMRSKCPEMVNKALNSCGRGLPNTLLPMPYNMCGEEPKSLVAYYKNLAKEKKSEIEQEMLDAYKRISDGNYSAVNDLGDAICKKFMRKRTLLDAGLFGDRDSYESEPENALIDIDDTFPVYAKVAKATPFELWACKCKTGSLRRYRMRKWAAREVFGFCFGDDVDGEYVGEYVNAHPELKDLESEYNACRGDFAEYCDVFKKCPND